LGSKGLWEHVSGTALVPQWYAIVANISVLADGTTAATKDQVKTHEDQVKKYNKESYLAQHVILLTTSLRLGAKIKNFTMVKEMWDIMKMDATEKSTLFLIDAEDTLSLMRCSDSLDPKTHLTEITAHFKLMVQCCDSLTEMGSTLSDTWFSTMIMSSLPASYRPALQTIMAAERVHSAQSTLIPGTTVAAAKKMSPTDLMAFFLKEANHWIIEEAKHPGKTALFVQGKSRSIHKATENSKKARCAITAMERAMWRMTAGLKVVGKKVKSHVRRPFQRRRRNPQR
jgi:hypothetical protein